MTQIVLPMAGEGLRFQSDYPKSYKPFIEVAGKFLFQYALESTKDLENSELIFILKHQDIQYYKELINKLYPRAKIKALHNKTRGALETVYLAKEFIDPEKKLLVLDSDLTFKSSSFIKSINNASPNENGFPIFNSDLPKYSYCQEINGVVSKTAEKEVISNSAIVGAYFFGKAGNFLNAATEILLKETPEVGEFYIAPIFNQLIVSGLVVTCHETSEYSSLGTPEELRQFIESINA